MTLGSHQQSIGKSQVHITPRWIIDALGPFDLDPCANEERPWDCAVTNIALPRDGLQSIWHGMVWLNPPFHRYQVGKWIERLAKHGDGIALLHARTETDWFSTCWQKAAALLFLRQRLTFCRPDGSPCVITTPGPNYGKSANSGAPPVLVAFGSTAADRLARCGIPGALVRDWRLTSPT